MRYLSDFAAASSTGPAPAGFASERYFCDRLLTGVVRPPASQSSRLTLAEYASQVAPDDDNATFSPWMSWLRGGE